MPETPPPPIPGRRRPHRRLIAVFITLALADLALTATVLALGGFEANPIAARIHAASGFYGLIGLKTAVVLGVLAACRTIARRHPATAKRLLVLGIALGATPVLWSTGLLVWRSWHAWHCDVCGWHNGF